MATNIHKEPLANMTYDEIESWYAQYPDISFKPNLRTYVIWKDGVFLSEGDFFHKQSDGTYKYNHTIDYTN